MDAEEQQVRALLRQRSALAEFGQFAFRTDSREELLAAACRIVRDGLGTDFAKVLEREPDGEHLVVRAGTGWRDGVIGAKVRAHAGSAAGCAVVTGRPVVATDLAHETRFEIPAFLVDHGVRSLVNVVILGRDGDGEAYGVLEVDSRTPRVFDEADIAFLQNYANLLAAAIQRFEASEELRAALDERLKLFETNQQPLLVLDADLTVVRANPAFLRSFQVSAEETVGRRLADLGNGQWDIPELHRLLGEIAREGTIVREHRVDHVFEAIGERRMLIAANKVRGERRAERILLAIRDVTEVEHARERAEMEKELAQKTVDAVREALITLTRDLRIEAANESFYTLFDAERTGTEGKLIYEIAGGEFDVPRLRELLERILLEADSFDDFEIEHDFPRIGHRVLLLNARRLDHTNRILLAIRDVTEQRRSEAQQKVLVGELQHRVKNILTMVQSLARQTGQRSGSVADFLAAYEGRLQALTRVQDRLMRTPEGAASLRDLLARELEVHGGPAGEAYSLEGPDIVLPGRVGQALVMMVHELCTNAVKYGALSVEGGHVGVRWSIREVDGVRQLEFAWRETGVTITDTAPERGFGTRTIERSLPYMLGGSSELVFHPDGVACSIALPLERD